MNIVKKNRFEPISGSEMTVQFSSVHIFLNSLHTIYNHITKLAIQIINETTYSHNNSQYK